MRGLKMGLNHLFINQLNHFVMEKLFRFSVLFVLYVIAFIVVYSSLPAIVWVFGGSFRDVAQSVPYAVFGIIFINASLGIVFSECFDTNFKSKR